eukprot:5705462-Lingulodinium_polyedra.AAC.1
MLATLAAAAQQPVRPTALSGPSSGPVSFAAYAGASSPPTWVRTAKSRRPSSAMPRKARTGGLT